MFPLLRPDCPEFDEWLDAQDPSQMTETMLEDGERLLPPAESERIAREHERGFPDLWRSFVDDVGDPAEAEQMVLAGAIVSALQEARTIDPDVLELIEERGDDIKTDPAELLALVLDPTDVWSIAEAAAVDEALALVPDFLDDDAYAILWDAAIELALRQSWSERHERRLARLVRRLQARVRPVDRPGASQLLTDACAAFEGDEKVRRRLAALLLVDSIDLLPPAEELDALAA
jgi:hypothetical protein